MLNEKTKEVLEDFISCCEELLEVATLRGDNDLPSPPNDPKLWTARMSDAWSNFEEMLENAKTHIEDIPSST